MSYISDIQRVTQKSQLSFCELKDTIIILYGEEGEDGITTIKNSKMKTILNAILGSEGPTIAYAITYCPNASKVLRWYYDVHKGDGYITENNIKEK